MQTSKLPFKTFLTVFFVLFACLSYAQTIHVQAENKPLSQVLAALHEKHGIQISFNTSLLESCIINQNKTYNSPEQAIAALTKKCNFSYQKIDAIFVIVAQSPQEISLSLKRSKPKPKLHFLKCKVIDAFTQEVLPFATIALNDYQTCSNENGYFSYQSRDSIIRLRVVHMGYFMYDSVLVADGQQQSIRLKASIADLKEIVVEENKKIKSLDLAPKTALIKINNPKTPFLPGNSNNSVFSFLRLQAGIMAAGEQTNDYIIWGSYKGQSHILFDGITIFNTSSFNDEIGTINPLIINDIEVLKGGYNVEIGDRVGGVVNINSKSGHSTKFQTQFTLTNQLINGHINIPIAKRGALQFAVRSTYPNIFDPETYKEIKSNVYQFGDLNIKYKHNFKNGDHFLISLLGNIDKYDRQEGEKDGIQTYESIKNIFRYQLGGTMQYSKKWKKAGVTQFKVAYSQLTSSYFNKLEFENYGGVDSTLLVENNTNNGVAEMRVDVEHVLPSTRYQTFSVGLGFVRNQTGLRQFEDSTFFDNNAYQLKEDVFLDFKPISNRINTYIKDDISVFRWLNIQPGLRLDLLLRDRVQVFFQPRITVNARPHKNWNINLAYGIYRQFISENALLDKLGNYLYDWNINDGRKLPIPQSMHYVAGTGFDYEFLSGKIEGYYKSTTGLSLFYLDEYKDLATDKGYGRSYGVDFLLQTKFLNQKIWASYSLSKTEEKFENTTANNFQRAPHDQRHEFKIAGIFNIKPCFVSINYVYGSGFPDARALVSTQNSKPYSRLDVSFLYQLLRPKYKIEIGCSVLNVLNAPNIRYNDFLNFPNNETIRYSQGIPITPTLFLNFKF